MAKISLTPDPSLIHTQLSIRRGRATTTHYTHHQVSLMVSRNTTLVPSLGLRIRPACEAGLSAGMRRERVPPQIKCLTVYTVNANSLSSLIPQYAPLIRLRHMVVYKFVLSD